MNQLEKRLAVASKDSIFIILHFGHIKGFRICRQVAADQCALLERSEVDNYAYPGIAESLLDFGRKQATP